MRMMKLLLASLVIVPVAALAQPSPPTPPGPPPLDSRPHVCKPEGTVLFEMDTPRSTTKLFVDGAFEKRILDDKGKLMRQVGPACLPDADLRRLTKEIHAASWKIDNGVAHCLAIGTDTAWFKVNGKLVLTERLCGDTLEPGSAAALADATGTLNRATIEPLTDSPGKPVK
jgi:hypothetical protein